MKRTILAGVAALLATGATAQSTTSSPGTAPAGKLMTATQHANEGHKHANLARTPGTAQADHYAKAAEHYRKAGELTRRNAAQPRG